MSTVPHCPCETCSFPEVISNLPGLPAIAYRVGDFTAFREAMLQSLPGEIELANWKPSSTSDLALQMIEWWAYLADILTLYNERIANQAYLRTADQDVSVRNLVSVLGYRPRPGIGATATLAAVVSSRQPITLPQGMAVQSKPGPGSTPQSFELLAATVAQPGGSISADPDNSAATIGEDGSVLIEGTISSVKAGDLLLLVRTGWDGSDLAYIVGNVLSIKPQVSSRGAKCTEIFLSKSCLDMPAGTGATAPIAVNYRLMRSTQTARLFQYGVGIATSLVYNDAAPGQADLDSVARLIQPGDVVLFDSLNGQTGGAFAGTAATAPPKPPSTPSDPWAYLLPDEAAALGLDLSKYISTSKQPATPTPPTPTPTPTPTPDFSTIPNLDEDFQAAFTLQSAIADKLKVIAYGSGSTPATAAVPASMYLASVATYTELIWYADNPTNPVVASSANAGIPVLHSEITFTPSVSAPNASTLLIHYGWRDVGVVLPPPLTSFDGSQKLLAVTPPMFSAGAITALLQDASGNGNLVNGNVSSLTPSGLQLADDLPGIAPLPLSSILIPPINVLTNLLPFTRGKTVTGEVLGSGDATQAGQVFALAKSPLTYLLSAQSTSGNNYTSTLQVWVNGVQWQEQPGFYGQPANAIIFVTREDANAVTFVQFGDGINGARPPSGANNVTANYRYGSGADAPSAGTLNVINAPQPGLASLQNPVAAGGGADPEPSSQMRRYAPLSVLTFDRAISGDDYEAIAVSTPGVARASAIWTFDPNQQRTVVTVYVGDTSAAQSAAQMALSGDADPNRPVTVLLATAIPLSITLTLTISASYSLASITALAIAALVDASTGLLGSSNAGIGQAIYRSQIYAACLSVPGAIAVHSLSVTGAPAGVAYRFDPGPGGYFTLSPAALQITPEVANG